MTEYRYSYTGPLELYDLGRYAYHVLYAPPELQVELLAQQRPRVRISGELEGIPVNLAWQPSGDGRLYLIVSDGLRRARDLFAGDPVTVQFNVVDPDEVVVPPELEQLLEEDPLYAHLWSELTAGRLVFARGADRVTITVEPALAALADIAAEDILPDVALVGEELWVRQRRLSAAQRARHALLWGRATTTIRLTSGLPWQITARGGVSRLNADLRGLALSAF